MSAIVQSRAETTRGEVKVVPLANTKGVDLDRFIRVTKSPGIQALYAPYRDVWCPYSDDTLRKTLQPENPIWEHTDCQLFVATRDGVDCGRVLALRNPLSHFVQKQNAGCFGFFEAADLETARALLLDAAWPWVKKLGLSSMVGNVNPTTNDEVGVLVDGFHRHIFLLEFNPPEYPAFLEALGFRKAMDAYSYTATLVKETFAEVFSGKGSADDFEHMGNVMCKRAGVTLEYVNKRKIARAASEFCAAYNRSWGDHWGFEPFTSAELLYLAKDLLTFLPSNLLILARNKEGKVVGAALCAPDLNQILKKFDGRLGPIEMVKMLLGIWAPKWFPFATRPTLMRVIGLGVLPEYAKRGVAAALMTKLIENSMRGGFAEANASWILEANPAMIQIPERFGLKREQTWRFYEYRPTEG